MRPNPLSSNPIPTTSRRPTAALAGVLLGLACGCRTVAVDAVAPTPPAPRPERARADTAAEVEAFLAHYLEALESGEEAAIRELFVDDDRFAWFTDGALSYASPEDVLAAKAQYAGIQFETTASDVRVLALGPELAAASSRFETRLTLPDGGHHEYGGVITWIVEKDSEAGTWRVLRGHTSTPGGPPQGDKDGGAGRSYDR